MRKKSSDELLSFLFIIPASLVLLFSYVYPMINSLIISFTNWNAAVPGSSKVFIGLKNYTEILKDDIFTDSFIKTIIYVLIAVSIELIIGLLLSNIYSSNLRFIGFFRIALLVPLMMTPVVVGVLFRMMFNLEYGILNFFINFLGFESQNWLGTSNLAFLSILMVEIWQQLPFVIFVLSAGMQNLPINVLEAAKIDGANKFQSFKYITLPLLKPVIIIVLLLRIMDTFKVFDILYTLTNGGPGRSTELLSILIYKNGWKYFQLGRASSYSWIFLIVVFIATVFFIRGIYKTE